MSIEVRLLEDPAEHRAASALLAATWRLDVDQSPVSGELLRALAFTGGYVAGAFRDGELLGASAGFLTPAGHLHSHITGVAPGLEGAGLGLALKHHQRAWCTERGIDVVEWTYDPLVRRNGWFNVAKLGATVEQYLHSFYGAMPDGINAGDESDRGLVRWDLRAPGGRAVLEPVGATVLLDVDADGAPVPTGAGLGGPVLLVAAPADIVGLRTSDPAAARAWRLAVRATFGAALDAGYAATAMTPAGQYLLERRA